MIYVSAGDWKHLKVFLSPELINGLRPRILRSEIQCRLLSQKKKKNYFDHTQQVGTNGQKNFLVFNFRCKGNIKRSKGI